MLRVIKLKTENNSHTKSHEDRESLLSPVRCREGTIGPDPRMSAELEVVETEKSYHSMAQRNLQQEHWRLRWGMNQK